MKKPVALLVVFLIGVVSIIATSPPPLQGLFISTRNTEGLGRYNGLNEENVFACLNDEVTIDWYINSSSGLITATPLGRLNPEVNQKQVSNADTAFTTTVLGEVVVTLQAGDFRQSVNLGLLSQDVCQNFPINLIANFLGTLEQTLPAAETLPQRSLKLRWRNNALQATLSGSITSVESGTYERSAPCQLFPDEDKLICSAGDEASPSFRLEGVVTTEAFTGTYQGIDESTGVAVSFEGTFNFEKVASPGQP